MLNKDEGYLIFIIAGLVIFSFLVGMGVGNARSNEKHWNKTFQEMCKVIAQQQEKRCEGN